MGGICWYRRCMHEAEYRGRHVTVASVMVVLGVVLGVLSMHSVSVVASTHEMASDAARSTTHVTMGHALDRDAASLVVEPGTCPSGHQSMHPCMGTVSSWPSLPLQTSVIGLVPAADSVSEQPGAVVARTGRAPPWAVSSLDESVLLRV